MKPIMLTLVAAAAILFYTAISHGATPSKDEIIQTIEHMKALTADAQAEAQKAKQDLAIVQTKADQLAEERDAAVSKLSAAKAEAHENAKERDVILYAFALLAALYLGTFFAGPIMREFPTPWNIVGASACYLVAFGFSYFIGRVCLHALAGLIP